jgi:alpha-1,2-mannosyltransferase
VLCHSVRRRLVVQSTRRSCQCLQQNDHDFTSTDPYRPEKAPFELSAIVAFYVFLVSHLIAALYSPIQDCDEVFNFWEPTHYLNHHYGFQTWEYSPVYAIRSWAYTGLHATITGLFSRHVPGMDLPAGHTVQFYVLRGILAIFCAGCETRLFTKISQLMNPRVAIIYMMITATSPGFFHASISYLPSSFAMYFVMLSMAAFMDWRGGLRTTQGIFWMAVGACFGWPFAAAMIIPFLVEEALLGALADWEDRVALLYRLLNAAACCLLAVAAQVAVDTIAYRKLVFVPLNIVWYNVFGANGPDLYGVEPWHFYLRNLFLNFHVWVVLALLSMPLLVSQHFLRAKGATKASSLRGVVYLVPFYLWLAIFTLQPHKEERFMYPAYPALALNAAVAFHIILANLGSTDSKDFISKIPVHLRLLGILSFVIISLGLSAFRTVGTITAYGAPLEIYSPLQTTNISREGDILCLGKEWYRFPSHYLLPKTMRAGFIKSEFSGLLPGEFSESLGTYSGTWRVPLGMNDENREDMGKYTDLDRCDFIVDSDLPSTFSSPLEPNYIKDEAHWEKVQCLPFLDAASTGLLGRLGWIPESSIVPAKYRRVWGEYCLLKRRKN